MTDTTQSLEQSLWNSADILRSKMDANEYKNYTLGLIFYKYLSDNMLYHVADLLEAPTQDLKVAQENYHTAFSDEETQVDLIEALQQDLSYYIKPELTFTAQVMSIENHTFQLENLAQGFNDVESASETFSGLFDDIDLYSKKLGPTLQKQNDTISAVMMQLVSLDVAGHSGDTLGDAYEYLIGQFASDSGKNAGEFYTPQAVSRLMTQIMMKGRENQKGLSVYDAAMGSGSLLLNAKRYSKESDTINYFGQELNTSTYNLARMNMILHGVPISNQYLHNADTLDADWPTEEPTNFDGVMMNPPYSAKWSAEKGFLTDPRFSTFGVLAPKSKADYAFLLHGYYHLKSSGVMAIVLPHGVLFRGAAEGKIRQKLLEEGAIDTVIGLPAGIFYNTSIPTTVIILNKNRTTKDVFFIDASKEFEKRKAQNFMTDAHIDKILEAYQNREDMEKFAHLASFDEIIENDYNLNIPRYVDTFEEETPIDLVALSKEITDLNAEIAKTEQEFLSLLGELAETDETKEMIEATKAIFR